MEHRPWADLVFHVLAHVSSGNHLAPSLHDASYCAQVAALLGSPTSRPLGEDILALGALSLDHETMATAQLLAWLFDSVEQAQSVAARSLASLRPEEVARPALLPALSVDFSELLFCAALLELDPWSTLPSIQSEYGDSLQKAILALTEVAPRLAGVRLASLRSLGLRGRVAFGEVWVGAPGWGQGTLERCSWQAAHEATVLEVSERWPEEAALHDAREELAIELLRRRAKARGVEAAHARWLSSFAEPRRVLGAQIERLLGAIG